MRRAGRPPSAAVIGLQAGACAAALGLLGLSRESLLDWSLGALGNLSTACAVLGLAAVVRITANGIWSAPAVYLAVLGVFHFGLTSVLGLGLLSEEMMQQGQISLWLHRSTTQEAAYLSTLGYLACTLGIHAGVWVGRLSGATRPVGAAESSGAAGTLGGVGAAVLSGSVLLWFLVVLRAGGPGLLISSYNTYVTATIQFGGALAFVWFGLACGLCFLGAAGGGRGARFALGCFGLFVLIGFPLGLRGEVLFSSLPALVILFKRRRPPSLAVTLACAAGLLLLISVVKNLRQVGLAAADAPAVGGGSVLDGLVELGGSLRPVSEAVLWRETGDPPLWGATYWAPIDRMLVYVIPGWSRPDAADDGRLMNVLVMERVGPIGFSPIAEAYYNFGAAGVAVVLFGVGLLLSGMERWGRDPTRLALLGVVLSELLINVRNSFVAVPAHLALGAVLLGLVGLLDHLKRQPSAPAPRRPSP